VGARGRSPRPNDEGKDDTPGWTYSPSNMTRRARGGELDRFGKD